MPRIEEVLWFKYSDMGSCLMGWTRFLAGVWSLSSSFTFRLIAHGFGKGISMELNEEKACTNFVLVTRNFADYPILEVFLYKITLLF